MPQLDILIFFPTMSYLLVCFIVVVYYNSIKTLPKIALILKFRDKIKRQITKQIPVLPAANKISPLGNMNTFLRVFINRYTK
jgi:hypothetical protein